MVPTPAPGFTYGKTLFYLCVCGVSTLEPTSQISVFITVRGGALAYRAQILCITKTRLFKYI